MGIFYSLVINLLAMAVAPLLIGTIADHAGLMTGLESAIVFQLMGGLLFHFMCRILFGAMDCITRP